MKRRMVVIVQPMEIQYLEVDVEPGVDAASVALDAANIESDLEDPIVLVAGEGTFVEYRRVWQTTRLADARDDLLVVELLNDREPKTTFEVSFAGGRDHVDVPVHGAGLLHGIRIRRP